MRMIFTRSKLPLSVAIRLVTGEDCSHFAVHFSKLGLIFESNLLGVHAVRSVDFFQGSLAVVHEIEVEATLEQEAQALVEMQEKIAGNGYGFTALLYACYRFILLRMFHLPLPERNAWALIGTAMCTQVYDSTPEWLIPTDPKLENLAILSPHMLYETLTKQEPKL